MKNLILLFTAAVLLTSCDNKKKRDAEIQKAKQAVIDSINMAGKPDITDPVNTAVAPPPEIVAGDKDVENGTIPVAPPPTKKNTVKKGTTPADQPTAKTNTEPTPDKPVGSTTPAPETGSAPAGTSTVAAKEEEKKKKGLNNAAKGAIIGLGTGAAAGAVIGKENRGKGAVIGGVVGAIGGAVGGAVLDKRKAKKAAEKDTVKTEKK